MYSTVLLFTTIAVVVTNKDIWKMQNATVLEG